MRRMSPLTISLISLNLGDPTDFPTLDSEEAKLAPQKQNKTRSKRLWKMLSLNNKNDEFRRDNMLNNSIIFNAEEPIEPRINKCKDHDQKVVTDLLKTIEVETTPE